MNNNETNTIIRAFTMGPNNVGYSAIPSYYQGNNQFSASFATAQVFQNHQQARQEIGNINTSMACYLEIIEVYPNYV